MTNKYYAIIFFLSFLFMMIITLRVLFDSQLHKIFKQGSVTSIRTFYIILAIAISYLISSAFIDFIKAIGLIISQ
ncbi:MAG: DUF1146 family protein [Bacilli bacterium]|jgi:uncharacterized membrane protein YwzB|nr:DUF1146 family protein [Bacilli bacterium]HHU23565.1 DUF1146 domain-containing protein [Acholeplasmataceae bacterium]